MRDALWLKGVCRFFKHRTDKAALGITGVQTKLWGEAMKVLVTGGAGFIGSHVTDLLAEEGHQIVVVDSLVSGKKENVNDRAKFYQVDIRDEELANVFEEERPEVVIHLAAQISVPRSFEDVFYDQSVNVAGTLHILELMHQFKARKIIYSSSAAVYGDPIFLPVAVDHPCVPVSPYGASKFLAEEYITLYKRMYGIDYAILRYANIYGPRQTPEGEAGVVSVFIDRLKKDEPLVIYGDGRHTRDFVYVGDVARANLAAMAPGKGATVNISTGVETSLLRLVEELEKVAGKKIKVEHGPERTGDIVRSRLCPDKALTLLGWKATMPLHEGLKNTYQWI